MGLEPVTEDVKKSEVSGEYTKYLYEEDKHEKTTLKATVECNLNTSRKTLSKVQVHLKCVTWTKKKFGLINPVVKKVYLQPPLLTNARAF